MDKILQKKIALLKYLQEYPFEYKGEYYLPIDEEEFNMAENKDEYMEENGIFVDDEVREIYKNHFKYGIEYLIVDDTEVQSEMDNRLNNYIDECILPNIPTEYENYFDWDKWKLDNNKDKGSWLNPYDGNEEYENVENTTYYIYRQ